MSPTRGIHFCNLVTEFLLHILSSPARATILVICSTRDHFLEQLYAATHTQTEEPVSSETHQLFTKTIGLLSKSSKVRLAFCPTLEHFRAYISVLRATSKVTFDELQNNRPLLAILDLVALHVPTSEFSAQGLSRTIATTVEVAAREGMDLMLCECRNALDAISTRSGERLWYEHVPILNGSVRMAGEENVWRGQGVSVKRVAGRWFEFNDTDRTTEAVDI
ncbi:hypothetical protein PHISCL_04204 [Aspergillus sclerotialis]|uniref:Elongator complex protein 6 n=1 Tax=Aspergillus sclerotialis TaxID=2070753 RepID=A0A3A2ZK68_9EURO|nr:hypothetical protein PHISCL_04204 [Aspergillus sclerotialis]